MTVYQHIKLISIGCALALLAGCPRSRPTPVPPVEQPATPEQLLRSHLLGTWERRAEGKTTGRLIFNADGSLNFQGGLAFFNPGRWELDDAGRQLHLTLPEAPDDKLSIFKLQLGDGVVAFDRVQKRITYAFDAQTGSLNIAGWIYTKDEAVAPLSGPEPVLK